VSRLIDKLRKFTEAQGVFLTPSQLSQLDRLDSLLTRWSHAVDLSGFRDPGERFDRYFCEPLDASRWLPQREGGLALDLGSGGGSPALPLAVVQPGGRWTLLEPNRRKAVFLEEAVAELGLEGVRVSRSRLEAFAPEEPLDVVTSRGVALSRESLATVTGWLKPTGRLLLFTSRDRGEQLAEWKGGGRGGVEAVAQVGLAPGFKSWLVVLEKQ
jgi:16S rRNA (guanine527-N7)-methyltransferase